MMQELKTQLVRLTHEVEEIDRSVNGKHVLAAMLIEITEPAFTDEQVLETILPLTQEQYEQFIQHYKETLRAQPRASRRRWEREADKWARKIAL